MEYDISTATWKFHGSTSDPLRKLHAAACTSDGIFIHGGIYQKTSFSDLWHYSFFSNSWKQIQYRSEAPPPLYGHTININDNIMYAFGGYCTINDKFHVSNELYTFDTSKFKTKSKILNNSNFYCF